jgi:hypothetical protein
MESSWQREQLELRLKFRCLLVMWIRDLNGKPMNTLDTLRSTLRSLPAGAPVTLQIQREGKLIYLSFTLD